jgi:2-polyprenyl-6-methoxyphenol hydroxylase-like FAD-dependent oxidoreductase
LEVTPSNEIFERRLGDRPPLGSWTALDGRVVLIGDAAHPMVPSQGQGTMVTWEDAADLAALVASKGATPAATKAFEKRRKKRCDTVQKFSAVSYMGRPSPARNPRKLFRMLGNFRRIKQMYSGFAPLDELPGEPFARWAWSGPVFGK